MWPNGLHVGDVISLGKVLIEKFTIWTWIFWLKVKMGLLGSKDLGLNI